MASIEIDGKSFEVENGKMIIEVADEAGIHIPRFCYHKKLSVAANCRMCLVEIENSKKTVPACATPISQGMKVFTQSAAALKSQKAVMEFLLINHPLDCPICDQGGECELQDVSMGFGSDQGEYRDSKRSVHDKSLGSLIETEMTRCIHCTRCVRFGEEIAGLREMGAPYRGENVQIGTYVESSLRSEVSGNIIDLCPVGALTSKPYRYTARAWEMTQKSSIAPHDCLGSNVYVHTRRGKVMRIIPKECEAINETWLSDRDRFSYTGLYSEQRLPQPMIKQNGQWKTVDWSSALNFTASKLGEVLAKNGPESLAAFASASSTTEEFYILQKWMRALKVENIDFRTRQIDFSGEDYFTPNFQNNLKFTEIENQETVFLLGTQVHREVPLAGTKVRKAYLNGASIISLNAADYEYPFVIDDSIISSPADWEAQLLAIMSQMNLKDAKLPKQLELLSTIKVEEIHKNMATKLNNDNTVIVTGHLFENHPRYAVLRLCLEFIIKNSSIKWIHLSQGANSKGACAAGFYPNQAGKSTADLLKSELKAIILHGIEPSFDFSDISGIRNTLNHADFVIAVSAYDTEDLRKHADVILPMANFTETSGTFINLDDKWQTFEGVAQAYGEARPAWKIYRVLANLTHCADFDYVSSEEILNEMKTNIKTNQLVDFTMPIRKFDREQIYHLSYVPLYRADMLSRQAAPLQESASADSEVVSMHSRMANKLNISDKVTVSQGNNKLTLSVTIDNGLHDDVISLPVGFKNTVEFTGPFMWVSLEA